MHYILKIAILFLWFIPFTSLLSQREVKINVQSQYLVSSDDHLQPHYQYANQWGIISPFEQSQGLIMLCLKYKIHDSRNVKLDIGTSGVLKDQTSNSFLHEAYLNAKFFDVLNVSIGKQAYSPLSYNDEIMVGAFMRNANARPIPRAQIGIFDYQAVSFLNGAIEVKGGLSHGILNDDRTASGRSNSANDVQVHEKWAYVRLGGDRKYKPYIGLFHGALMAGERAKGEKIEIDYWATVLGKGSNTIKSIDATNAIGAHDGFWDFGFNFSNEKIKMLFFLQKPYADKTGLILTKFRNKDYKIGSLIEVNKGRKVKSISVEVFRTDVQADYGLPDAIYPEGHSKEGQIVWLADVIDYDAFMLEVFGEETKGYDKSDTRDYMIEHCNFGYKYGGRDDYNNNWMYYNAWTYHGQSMGLPLYHTYNLAQKYAPDWNANNRVVFVNNRIKGFHVGIEGELLTGINYTTKLSYTNNLGSYNEEFISRGSWVEDPEFFYQEGKKQVYTYLSLDYKNKRWNDFSIQGSFSYDRGELYDAFGCMLGVKYSPSINL